MLAPTKAYISIISRFYKVEKSETLTSADRFGREVNFPVVGYLVYQKL